jgi:hypothetical protein
MKQVTMESVKQRIADLESAGKLLASWAWAVSLNWLPASTGSTD